MIFFFWFVFVSILECDFTAWAAGHGLYFRVAASEGLNDTTKVVMTNDSWQIRKGGLPSSWQIRRLR